VEHLEDLLSMDWVDMVEFGQADYAMSIGLARQLSHPQVREAEEHVISTAFLMGIAPRAELSDRESAEVPRHGRQAPLHRHRLPRSCHDNGTDRRRGPESLMVGALYGLPPLRLTIDLAEVEAFLSDIR